MYRAAGELRFPPEEKKKQGAAELCVLVMTTMHRTCRPTKELHTGIQSLQGKDTNEHNTTLACKVLRCTLIHAALMRAEARSDYITVWTAVPSISFTSAAIFTAVVAAVNCRTCLLLRCGRVCCLCVCLLRVCVCLLAGTLSAWSKGCVQTGDRTKVFHKPCFVNGQMDLEACKERETSSRRQKCVTLS